MGDHYDPDIKAVRLMPDRFHGRSLTAAVIAAHEIGHAMQDATDFAPLKARTRLAKSATSSMHARWSSSLAAPPVTILFRHPIGVVFLDHRGPCDHSRHECGAASDDVAGGIRRQL